MKWEAVKKKVADEIYTAIKYRQFNYEAAAACLLDSMAERRTFQESADELADKCHAIVMRWDVRRVEALRDMFPQYFSPSLRKGRLVAEMEDSEDAPWVVYRA